MLFNSLPFLLFFPTVFLLYFTIAPRGRWALLLGASYFFYMSWEPAYAVLILISTAVSYAAARLMYGAGPARKRWYLAISLTVNLGILVAYKYFNFFNDTLRSIFSVTGADYPVPDFKVLLPVGISFYTFQVLSYTIDVFRGTKEPETHFGIYALYVSFFPQLVAGPIERSTRLLPQFKRRRRFEYERVADGARLMLWGYFKKIIIADRVAMFVDQVYGAPADHPGGALILATYLFAFQIFCDFSAYSDIAIGCARMLGYDLMTNFRRPYHAQSLAEFWQRWHISLSTWFRDYVYIPLGGSRVGTGRRYRNIMTVFLLSGMWHGANWTFVVWGALHGVVMVLEAATAAVRENLAQRFFGSRFSRLRAFSRALITFHIVCLLWIFFRAESIAQAGAIIGRLAGPDMFHDMFAHITVAAVDIWIGVAGIVVMEAVHLLERRRDLTVWIGQRPPVLRWGVYAATILAVLNFRVEQVVPFIYFQF